jgi:phosphoglycolate phosphatase
VADVRRFVGGGAGQMLRGALEASGGVDEAALPACRTSSMPSTPNIARHSRLFPGGAAMLDALDARGVRIAVATNKKESMAVRLFEELGMLDRFATVIGGDTLGGSAKPAPDMLHAMVERCGGGRLRGGYHVRHRRGARGGIPWSRSASAITTCRRTNSAPMP